MKNIKILALCAALSVLAACEKDKAVSLGGLYGEWKLEFWYGQSADKGTVPADVYLSFSSDGLFELYQKLGDSGHYSAFDGTFGLTSDGLLYGIYGDGKSWGANYSFSVEGDRLILENPEFSGYGRCVYVRTTIPDSVRKDADDYDTVKSSSDSGAVKMTPVL